MNKSALKVFASSARKELLKKVEAKAMKIGITEDNIKKAEIESSDAIYIDGKQLSKQEKDQRDRLVDRINQIGFKRVMEEVAYTWFNRFTALRYMEVNEHLPTDVRVLSSTNPESADPDMINEALSLDLEIDKEYVYELKLNNKTEEIFKYLIIKHCNDLNRYLPFMFETIDDYTEILFPEGLLAKDSFIREMTNIEVIPEDNWRKVEVIGWLYQYYIAEEKDRVIKAKKKYKTEEIPFATQLFTPDWIVRYMVQNSLGRYWIESHPEHRDLLSNWEYYLENPNPESDFEGKIAPYINKELKVEDIKCFDPAMGSGHILVYMFDVLYEIYSKCGYVEREIPRLIIENNLYGLDIDDRAYQLACFSVVMKALEYNDRFFRSIERDGLTLNLTSIQETNNLTHEDITYLAGEPSEEKFELMEQFLKQFQNAKTIGALIKLHLSDLNFLQERITMLDKNYGDLFEMEMKDRLLNLYKDIVKQFSIMNNKYDVLVTNPPYVGNKYLTDDLSNYLSLYYQDVKTDLFSAFIEYSFNVVNENGHIGFMTPFVWMFISSYEKLRNNINQNRNISSLIQLEYSGFEEATVPICTFTLRNYFSNTEGDYIKLSDFRGAKNQSIKTLEACQNPNVKYRYSFNQVNYSKIPGSPIAYWVNKKVISIFEKSKRFSDIIEAKQGLKTADNDRFLRRWFECDFSKIGFNFTSRELAKNSNYKWFPYNKGGSFRKWYGNQEFVVNWEKDGLEIREFRTEAGKLKSRPQNLNYFFKESVSWSDVTSSKNAFRYYPEGFIFDATGHSSFPNENVKSSHILGVLNNKFFEEIIKLISPTMHFDIGYFNKLPAVIIQSKQFEEIVEENIEIAKLDWDSFETSWEFQKHPFIGFGIKNIESAFNRWKEFKEKQFKTMKHNEERLNEIFFETYDLKTDLTIEVEERDITITKAELENDIVSFISYGVGCIFGRYSIDESGLIYAGGQFDPTKYQSLQVDKDNILPILPGAYFEDDIVSRFIDFVQVTLGVETLTENLEFIAEALGKRKGETAKETIRRYFLNDFFKDHVQTYKKRPIYWLFTSGKQKAFNCLIYMHRYDKTTISRIRTDYLHEYQIRLDAERKSLVSIIEGDSTTKEISNAKKEIKALDKKIEELNEYDELLHHMADMQIEIDLDDGVAINYEKFNGLVTKI
ncbi:BREX-1 system adenine-specific DNA-methyltransferase PglX [Bacillus massiliglaciei]|uniref:BREX-1 system adenine-specific DNA-methyltransferase PglX n=1 Tax=Bacillus massiliglaciei TaxID=1816693 RepID=UPI000A53A103|nr:BREX-1 system adenine-specific DNA-methyltransferase PglX [Bacillus massiliglaciei]